MTIGPEICDGEFDAQDPGDSHQQNMAYSNNRAGKVVLWQGHIQHITMVNPKYYRWTKARKQVAGMGGTQSPLSYLAKLLFLIDKFCCILVA